MSKKKLKDTVGVRMARQHFATAARTLHTLRILLDDMEKRLSKGGPKAAEWLSDRGGSKAIADAAHDLDTYLFAGLQATMYCEENDDILLINEAFKKVEKKGTKNAKRRGT